MPKKPYSWTIADWQAFFVAQGESPEEAHDLAEQALQGHKEARESGWHEPDDTAPRFFGIGFSC